MDLDSLKEIWKEAGPPNMANPEKAEIMEMLNKSSKGPIARMIHSVITEAIVIIVIFGGVAIYYFIAFNGRFNAVAWVYILTAMFLVIYYYFKWKLLNEMQCVSCRVKSNLQHQVGLLERYIGFYLKAGTAMVPMLFILLGILFYYKFPNGSFSLIFPPLYKSAFTATLIWLGWGVSLALLTLFTYAGNRWFINKLYRRHILKLKGILDQMEEE